MSTVFIAVQCCQCSTMQVKQRKKSSNKWTCVVCNQKQSVLKVFAQALMAKDVRKFVQTFNMSRQLAEQNQSLQSDEQTLGSPSQKFEADDLSPDNRKKKRTDWTEYIDPEQDEDDVHDSEDMFEEKFVTELPKPLFKKPKLSNYNSSSTGLPTGMSAGTSYRPVFGKRSSSYNYKQLNSSEKEPTKSGGLIMDWSDCTEQTVGVFATGMKYSVSKDKDEPSHAAGIFSEEELMRPKTSKDIGASKWRGYVTEEDRDNNLAAKAPQKLRSTSANSATSKWNDYLTEEDDDDNADFIIRCENENHRLGRQNDLAFHTTLNDQTVEEDIHPVFQRAMNLDQWL